MSYSPAEEEFFLSLVGYVQVFLKSVLSLVIAPMLLFVVAAGVLQYAGPVRSLVFRVEGRWRNYWAKDKKND